MTTYKETFPKSNAKTLYFLTITRADDNKEFRVVVRDSEVQQIIKIVER